ncbi:DUF3576 domain-containing protein [Thalassococcus sp. CAU 1522]|uniref:DUF3576 domain-containing protein n=1 Tax=Thalassococcus arenae TaxID=2851652 RepID=A0ABS6N4E0_9RHOB|nr:DUF3576 domain-containing protein [Thalassococcus arenae]MBV2358876.1 DUF3576 domain-containing protein [Thalassococcus arenae]
MKQTRLAVASGLTAVLLLTSGCGAFQNRGGDDASEAAPVRRAAANEEETRSRGTIWDLFRERPDPGRVGAVNKYLWNASLETLDFLPVQSVDPFTGVITTGFGTPPGGGQAYRATILISDPALDARSLNLALMTRSGPASAATVRAVEDAILTRARQLREQDGRL